VGLTSHGLLLLFLFEKRTRKKLLFFFTDDFSKATKSSRKKIKQGNPVTRIFFFSRGKNGDAANERRKEGTNNVQTDLMRKGATTTKTPKTTKQPFHSSRQSTERK